MLIPGTALSWMFACVHARWVADPVRLMADLEVKRDKMIERAAEMESDTLAAAADHLDRLITVLNLARTVLVDVGRPDLAELILWFDDDGGYIEVMDPDDLDEPDWAIIDKAETIARASIGLPPLARIGDQ